MDKEFTYFIVDLSPSMGGKSCGREVSDLDYALQYLYDVVAQKILRAKKLDQVSVIALHHPETDNPLANEDENTNIKIVTEMGPASFTLLKMLKRELKVNESGFTKTEGDIIKSLLVAFAKAYDQTKTSKKATVNIVLLTNCKSAMETDEELGGYMSKILSACNDAKVHVAAVDFNNYSENDDVKRQNELKWNELFRLVNNGSSIFNFEEALALTQDISKAIPRLVRPVRTFDGELRLGGDLDLIDEMNFRYKESGIGDDLGEIYDQNQDPISLCMKVEGFPFIKRETLMSAKTFTAPKEEKITAESLHPVKFIKDLRVQDTEQEPNENEERPTKSVAITETVNVFKYGTSITPLNETLANAVKFRTFPGIDIRGIVKLEDLPACYLTDESVLITNKGAMGSRRDITSFNSLCVALLNLGSVAIVRYVLKANAEVNMGALIPTIVNADRLKPPDKRSSSDEGTIMDSYCFALVRLPFKEDEKIPSFNKLSRVIENEVDKKYANYIPDEEMLKTMTEYVEAMDLDPNDAKRGNDEKFLTPNEYEFSLPVPYNLHHSNEHTRSGRLNKVTGDLIHPSPGIHILQGSLKKLINEICPISEEDDELPLADLMLRDPGRVDQLLELYHKDLRLDIAHPKMDADRLQEDIVPRLIKLLDNKLVQEDRKRGKRSNYDEVMVKNNEDDDDFDIDEILAAGNR